MRERRLREGQGPGTGHLKGHLEEKTAREAEEELLVRQEAGDGGTYFRSQVRRREHPPRASC